MIVQTGPHTFELRSKSTGRVLGTHPSYARAAKQEAAIQIAKHARRNPVQELLQTHTFAPGHTVLEWVDVDDAQWVDAQMIQTPNRRPPRKPGPHLVTSGAQLLFMQEPHGTELSFSRSLFVKHHHRWEFLAPAGYEAKARIDASGQVEMLTPIDQQDELIMQMMLAYVMYEAKEHGVAFGRREAKHARARASYVSAEGAFTNPSKRRKRYEASAQIRFSWGYRDAGEDISVAPLSIERDSVYAAGYHAGKEEIRSGEYSDYGRAWMEFKRSVCRRR